ncbi:MAG: YdeI/OmpD-associated family protein [Pseudomonadota bacterium]
MIETERFEEVAVDTTDALWDWLERNHETETSVWLVTWKRAAGEKYVSVDAVLDALIAYGWIDGIRRKRTDLQTMQLISPRKVQHWSKSYKDRAARLEREGRMQPAGRRAIEAAKASGLWTFMDDVDALIVPSDLDAALTAEGCGAGAFAALPGAYRRNVLRWIKLAKTPKTRAKRVEKAAVSTAKNERLPQM